jgi:hypothetical protein
LRFLLLMSQPPVRQNRLVLQCEECRRKAETFELGWSAFYVQDPDEGGDAELVMYCADCLRREFGGSLRWLTAPTRQAS